MNPTFQGEVQLRRWSDSSTQGVQVTFALPDSGELEPIKHKVGKRFMAVLVEIGDDEQPVQQQQKPKGGEIAKWLALRCQEEVFQTFVATTWPDAWSRLLGYPYTERAAMVVRQACEVESRAEIDNDPYARARFDQYIRGPWQKHCIATGATR